MDAEVGEVRWIGDKEGDLNTMHLSCGHVVAVIVVIVDVSFSINEDLLVTIIVDVPRVPQGGSRKEDER